MTDDIRLFARVLRHDKAALVAGLQSADINTRSPSGMTLLHAAAGKSGSLEIADELIRRGIGLDLQDEDGATALIIATVWRKAAIAELILRSGARVDVTDDHGNQALWYAVRDPKRDDDVIRLLMRFGADPHHRNRCGKTPVDAARKRGIASLVEVKGES